MANMCGATLEKCSKFIYRGKPLISPAAFFSVYCECFPLDIRQVAPPCFSLALATMAETGKSEAESKRRYEIVNNSVISEFFNIRFPFCM
jgi:hypothetical protein